MRAMTGLLTALLEPRGEDLTALVDALKQASPEPSTPADTRAPTGQAHLAFLKPLKGQAN